MPKTLLEKVVFTIVMATIMVYGMIVYNVALNTGGVTNLVRNITKSRNFARGLINLRLSCYDTRRKKQAKRIQQRRACSGVSGHLLSFSRRAVLFSISNCYGKEIE